MTDEIINGIRTAYADAGEQRDDPAYVHEMRCLSFLASGWLTPENAAEAVQYIGGYNAFDPDTVGRILDAIEEADEDALIAIGRESSPALYVETDDAEAVIDVFEDEWVNEDASSSWERDATPDELSVTDVVSNYRKDWYDEDDRDVHQSCAHESPPVPVEEFAEADPDREHVRAWWD